MRNHDIINEYEAARYINKVLQSRQCPEIKMCIKECAKGVHVFYIQDDVNTIVLNDRELIHIVRFLVSTGIVDVDDFRCSKKLFEQVQIMDGNVFEGLKEIKQKLETSKEVSEHLDIPVLTASQGMEDSEDNPRSKEEVESQYSEETISQANSYIEQLKCCGYKDRMLILCVENSLVTPIHDIISSNQIVTCRGIERRIISNPVYGFGRGYTLHDACLDLLASNKDNSVSIIIILGDTAQRTLSFEEARILRTHHMDHAVYLGTPTFLELHQMRWFNGR